MKSLCFFDGSFFKWKNWWHLEVLMHQIFGQGFIYFTVFWRLLSKEMSAKSLKFFGPPTTKWWPCKIFGKLNGNHLLMANTFKFYEYQTFGLMKIHNMYKTWSADKIFSLLRWNKKYFSWFFKGFQLPEIILSFNYIGHWKRTFV